MRGRVVLIPGGARGIGAAVAGRCVGEGATVVVADVRGDEGNELVAGLGDAAHFARLDVRDPEQWRALSWPWRKPPAAAKSGAG